MLRDYTNQFHRKYHCREFEKTLNANLTEYFYKIGCRICDIEYHIARQIDPIYLNKKKIGDEAYKQIIHKYKKFLLLINFRL